MGTESLVVAGFLTDRSIDDYKNFVASSFGYLSSERTRELLVRYPVTDGNRRRLHQALQDDIVSIKHQQPQAKYLAIATPGLEMLTEEEANTSDFKIISQVDMLVKYCTKNELKYVGLIGTEWDVTEEGPLVTALQHNGIQVGVPDSERFSGLTCIVANEQQRWVEYKRNRLTVEEFCTETINYMLYSSVGEIKAIIFCNPEFRPCMHKIQAASKTRRRLDCSHMLSFVDAAMLYWNELSQLSQ